LREPSSLFVYNHRGEKKEAHHVSLRVRSFPLLSNYQFPDSHELPTCLP
jgi:hypothetical protein